MLNCKIQDIHILYWLIVMLVEGSPLYTKVLYSQMWGHMSNS